MRNQDPTEPSGLSGLLRKKVGYLEEFLAATESLYHCLKDGEPGKADSLVEKRRSLAHSVDAVDQEIQAFRSAGSETGNLSADPLGQRSKELRETLKRIVHKTAEWDQKCIAQAELLRGEIKREMTSIREGWRATHGYVKQLKVLPRFMDVIK
jgi:hypothetical protein